MPTLTILILLSTALLASTASLILYKIDKSAAIRGQHRIRERTLHLTALVGGWPGAIAAQKLFRHKTRDQPFRTVFWCTVALHLAAVGIILYIATRVNG